MEVLGVTASYFINTDLHYPATAHRILRNGKPYKAKLLHG